MKKWRLRYTAVTLSHMLKVSRSVFSAWLHRKPSRRTQEDERLKIAIKIAHTRTRESYSAKRLQPELTANGFIVGRDCIARLRRELGLRCRQKRKFKTTNQLESQPACGREPSGPNFFTKRPKRSMG